MKKKLLSVLLTLALVLGAAGCSFFDVVTLTVLEIPDKTEYFLGESLDLTGGWITVKPIVKETYEVPMATMIEGVYTVTPGIEVFNYKKDKPGTQTVKLKFLGAYCNFSVKVLDEAAPTVDSVAVNGIISFDGSLLNAGEAVSLNDGLILGSSTLSVTYSDESEKIVPITSSMVQISTLTGIAAVTYGGKSASVDLSANFAIVDNFGDLNLALTTNYKKIIFITEDVSGVSLRSNNKQIIFGNGSEITVSGISDGAVVFTSNVTIYDTKITVPASSLVVPQAALRITPFPGSDNRPKINGVYLKNTEVTNYKKHALEIQLADNVVIDGSKLDGKAGVGLSITMGSNAEITKTAINGTWASVGSMYDTNPAYFITDVYGSGIVNVYDLECEIKFYECVFGKVLPAFYAEGYSSDPFERVTFNDPEEWTDGLDAGYVWYAGIDPGEPTHFICAVVPE